MEHPIAFTTVKIDLHVHSKFSKRPSQWALKLRCPESFTEPQQVYDIDETHHQEIQKLRENIHDLTAYLQGEGIFHILAHPLYSINDRLTMDHFEQLLLLFQNFEMNGARDDRQSQCLQSLPQRREGENQGRRLPEH